MTHRRLILTAAAALAASCLCAQPKIVAHRGFFNAPGSAPNSLTALRGAGRLGVYATEFDVRMTTDKVLVVYPNRDIHGHIIRESQFKDISGERLDNGEPLPTLDETLEAAREYPDLTLVIDFKDGRDEADDREIAELTVAAVRAKRMEARVKYISFNMKIVDHLVRIAPDAVISFIASDGFHSAASLRKRGTSDIDYKLRALQDQPDLVSKAHAEGMKVDAWTLNTPEDLKAMRDLGADYLETDYPDKALIWLAQ